MAAVRVASAATVTTEDAFDESLVPRAVSVVEIESLLRVLLSEPERLALRKANGGEPRVAGRIVRKLEDDIDLLERAEGSLRVEEVDQGDDGEVCDGEDDPCTIGNALECDRGDEDDTVSMLVAQLMRWTRIVTYTKLSNQLALVERPLAGPRIRSGTISTWYNQAIPCHPIAKKTEKMNKNTVLAILPACILRSDHRYCRIVMSIMHTDMPEAPNIISERRPQKRSIPTTTMNEARK